jgi:kynurenine formamidase
VIVDLSHPIRRGGFVYPGLPGPEVRPFRSHADGGPPYAPGTTFEMTRINAVTNIGTYLDSPFHRHAGAPDFTGVPLERVADLPGVVVDVRGSPGREIPAVSLPREPVRGSAVLFLTGWSSRWGTPAYEEPGPFLGREAAAALAAARPAVVGIDCMNIDDVGDPERPVHTLLLGAGIPICEHMTNLERLAGVSFRFTAAPPAWEGVASFPVRAFAVVG